MIISKSGKTMNDDKKNHHPARPEKGETVLPARENGENPTGRISSSRGFEHGALRAAYYRKRGHVTPAND
jgi:hypothetical protein